MMRNLYFQQTFVLRAQLTLQGFLLIEAMVQAYGA